MPSFQSASPTQNARYGDIQSKGDLEHLIKSLENDNRYVSINKCLLTLVSTHPSHEILNAEVKVKYHTRCHRACFFCKSVVFLLKHAPCVKVFLIRMV